jgi:hypothetical protein
MWWSYLLVVALLSCGRIAHYAVAEDIDDWF